MVAVPVPTPETTPEVELTLAVPDALLVQVPPVGEELNVIVAPEHTADAPDIAAGAATTVMVCTVKQPLGNV